MTWLQAVALGLVQGLTEFLPISSSAHLRLVAALAGWSDPGAAFTAVTQLGTEAAVLLFFRHDLTAIGRAWSRSLFQPETRSDPDARLGWFVLAGSIPIVGLGFALQEVIETTFRDLRVIAAALIGFALVLAVADRVARNRKRLSEMTLPHALAYGFAQSLALVPGVSRSGGTISGGLLLGYQREAATRYSFLLALPAVLGSGMLELTKIGGIATAPWGSTLLATGVAFAVGYAAIGWMLRYISHHTFTGFVVYRLAIGTVVLGLLVSGVLTPTGP